MNWLDKVIGWFAPARAYRRVHARMSMQAAERFAYEAARSTRRTSGWLAPGTGPNAEIAGAADRLRNRSRDLVRNNAHAARVVAAISHNAVGTGIVARTPAREVAEAWRSWIEVCDADGTLDWYGIQTLVARAVVESGECLVRFRPRRREDGIWPPLQLQVLEPDYLDASKTGPTDNGYAISGIQYDLIGRRVGYWLYQSHPGERFAPSSGLTSSFVPASEVLHIYRKDRPGQERGVPWLAPVIMRMRDLDEYEEAELVRKKIEACFSAFVVGGDPARTLGATRTDGTSGQRIEQFEPGMITYLSDAEDVRFATPQPNAGYADYVRHQLRAIATGLSTPYEILTGDLSQTNYSSIRAGLLEFRRMIEQFRWQVLIPQLCQPVWNRFTRDLGVEERVPVTWTPPKWEWVDPLKESAAVTAHIRSGLLTWREAVSEMGYDPDEQLAEIAATNQAWDEAGVVLDCDPRRVTQSGTQQKED
ncbi:MAG: phage portal protein [Bryobacteraceae bacterium]|nr:MAG: phage portal protein [Bryobacteraceae bacterium]